MRLTCPKCHHVWDDELAADTSVIQCPACFTTFRFKMDHGAVTQAPTQIPASNSQEPTLIDQPDYAPTFVEPIRPAAQISPAPKPPIAPPPPPANDPTLPHEPAYPMAASEAKQVVTGTSETFIPSIPTNSSPATQNFRPRPATDESIDDLFDDKPRSSDADTMRLTEWDTDAAAQDATGEVGNLPPSGGPSSPPPLPSGTGARTKHFRSASPKEMDLTGETIGGYRVSKMLGAGGMGAVCLAKQLSLDRDVALKILPGTFAANPEFLVRFTREALSAAQMTHHNIVQVYDVGSSNDYHYIAMEFVKGDNLGSMVKKEGPLRYEDACSFILQAARGLKFAHDSNIIHRDIKPDNIMVNDNGIVKIADMGLAKFQNEAEKSQPSVMSDEGRTLLMRAKGDLTMASVAMGTPSYMPPEQARDASTADHRADQYSLGCTLWYLLTGKTVYQGASAYDIIRKHMEAPLPNVDENLKGTPPSLKSIVMRMLAKNPEDRYADMGEVIRELEAVLGLDTEKGAYTPRERHLLALERIAASFYSAPFAKVRTLAVLSFFVGAPILTLLFLIMGQWLLAGLAFCTIATTPIAVLVLDGILNRNPLFLRLRAVFFGMSIKGWATTAALTTLTITALIVSGLLWPFLLASMAGLALAFGYQFGVNRRLSLQRESAMSDLLALLKELRLRGVPEEALQDFVCKFSGDHWEEMFEKIFGYDDMLQLRSKTAKMDKVRKRSNFATWRDPIARWLDQVEERRRIRREKATLAQAEVRRLKAQGKTEQEAKKQAEMVATQVVGDMQAAKIAKQVRQGIKPKVSRGPAMPSRPGGTDGIARLANILLGTFALLTFISQHFGKDLPPALQQLLAYSLFVPVPVDVRTMMLESFGVVAAIIMIFGFITAWRFTRFASLVGGVCVFGAIMAPKVLGSMIPGGFPLDAAMMTYVGIAISGLGVVWAAYQKSLGGKL